MTDFPMLGLQVSAIGWDYDVTGQTLGTIPDDHAVKIITPRGGVPTLTITVSHDAIRAERAYKTGRLLLVEVCQDQGGWVEPHDARFIITDARWNRVDGRRVFEVTAAGARWLLSGALVGTTVGNVTPEGYRSWPTVTAGAVMAPLLTAAKARTSSNGLTWFSRLAWSFTAAVDSDGVAWTADAPMTLPPGETLEYALTKIRNYGMAEWELRGWNLHLVRDGGLTRDLTATVVLRDSQSTDAPEQQTLADLCTDVWFKGDEAYTKTFHNETPFDLIGRFERSMSQGAVSLDSTASLHAQRLLVPGNAPLMQYMRESRNGESMVLPWIHVRDGDKVTIETDTGDEAVDVQGITVTRDRSGVHWSFLLGDRIDGLLTRLNRRADIAIAGAGVTGGDGLPPSPEDPDEGAEPAAMGVLSAAPYV